MHSGVVKGISPDPSVLQIPKEKGLGPPNNGPKLHTTPHHRPVRALVPYFSRAAERVYVVFDFGMLPYLILRVTGFDSASGPIPGNEKH